MFGTSKRDEYIMSDPNEEAYICGQCKQPVISTHQLICCGSESSHLVPCSELVALRAALQKCADHLETATDMMVDEGIIEEENDGQEEREWIAEVRAMIAVARKES
jgi:hypothetical protein